MVEVILKQKFKKPKFKEHGKKQTDIYSTRFVKHRVTLVQEDGTPNTAVKS